MMKRRTSKALLSLAMTAVLSLGTAVTAFAAPTPPATTDDNVKILKELQMDSALSVPGTGFTFDFEFTAKDFDGTTASATVVNGEAMPSVPETHITINTGDKDASASTGGLDVYKKESTNKIFDTVTWKAPGAYTYTVKEKASGYTNAATGETMTDSATQYEVTAYVKNNSSNTGFEIESIGVRTPGTTGTAGKVVVTPGISTNAFKFVNVFSKTAGGTNPLTQASLTVGKTVAASAHGDRSQYFPFTIDTTAAATETAGTTLYKAYLLEGGAVIPLAAQNKVSTETYNTDSDGNGDYIKVLAGATLKINLKHGQSVAFVGLGVGAKYEAEENAVTHYTADIALLTDGTTGSVSGTLATATSTASRTIGANTNSADFTNTYDETTAVTPTGISTSDLPFIGMLVLALGALGGFVVLKSRKRTTGAN